MLKGGGPGGNPGHATRQHDEGANPHQAPPNLDCQLSKAGKPFGAVGVSPNPPVRARISHAGTVCWLRDRTRFAIRRALVPLISGRQSSVALASMARAVNDRVGAPLSEGEVLDLLRLQVRQALRSIREGRL
jgi:hypothetical protein